MECRYTLLCFKLDEKIHSEKITVMEQVFISFKNVTEAVHTYEISHQNSSTYKINLLLWRSIKCKKIPPEK